MISRRDNLLIRPWDVRRYENHRKKVLSAAPAIDNQEPATRCHVLLKWKKLQSERETRAKIEKDNFMLLRNLARIMRTNRVDNCWTSPQPTFLNRITLYQQNMSKTKNELADESNGTQLKSGPTTAAGRKAKCSACSPQTLFEELQIPEERIPWKPDRAPFSVKMRDQFVIPPRSSSSSKSRATTATVKNSERTLVSSGVSSCSGKLQSAGSGGAKRKPARGARHQSPVEENDSPNSVLFTRGNLKLAVTFPADTLVKLPRERGREEMLC